jgi:hypothetical protein
MSRFKRTPQSFNPRMNLEHAQEPEARPVLQHRVLDMDKILDLFFVKNLLDRFMKDILKIEIIYLMWMLMVVVRFLSMG